MTQGYSVIWANLSERQRSIFDELVGHNEARTYKQVASSLGIHIGTLYTHIKRV